MINIHNHTHLDIVRSNILKIVRTTYWYYYIPDLKQHEKQLMKSLITAITFSFFLFLSLCTNAQINTSSQWTWVKGDNTINQYGIYGTQGTASTANKPGARYGSVSWTDASGNLWLFGGYGSAASSTGYLNDLWKYNPATNEWTWVKGDITINQFGVYGTQGTASAANKPGARHLSVAWTDASGNLWLFGGDGGAASGGSGSWGSSSLNDLWKYNPATNEWTWVKGDNTRNQQGIYGTQGTASTANKPGARESSVSWKDASGNLWLFGGYGNAATTRGFLNDLWKYNPATNEWTWVKGDNSVDKIGIYGTLGTASAANKPGARYLSATWTDASGNLWLFGGTGYDVGNFAANLNDLWKYNPSTNEWTWVKGDSTINQIGIYGTQGTASTANKPGARHASVSWTDASGNVWLFGGFGYAASGSGYLNDLWKYDPATNEWTWVKGDNTGNQPGLYGTQGTASAANKPGARFRSVSWKDASGNLWLFGGYGYSLSIQSHLNDLWKLGVSSTLPVDFSTLKASQKNAAIRVDWHMATETNTKIYEVQRSANGHQFVKAATVAATGSSAYNWLDVAPNAGMNYYRIKAISNDDEAKFSLVVRVNMSNGRGGAVSVYPIPITGSNFSLQLINKEKGNYTLRITNTVGQTLLSKTISHSGGSATQTVQLTNELPKGVYQLDITAEDGTKETKKLVIN
jgi:N-acetylneuraminic acid mutarotase